MPYPDFLSPRRSQTLSPAWQPRPLSTLASPESGNSSSGAGNRLLASSILARGSSPRIIRCGPWPSPCCIRSPQSAARSPACRQAHLSTQAKTKITTPHDPRLDLSGKTRIAALISASWEPLLRYLLLASGEQICPSRRLLPSSSARGLRTDPPSYCLPSYTDSCCAYRRHDGQTDGFA